MIARSVLECSSSIFVRSDCLNLTIILCIRAFLRLLSEKYMVSPREPYTGTGNADFSTCKSVFETMVASCHTHPKLDGMFCPFFMISKMVCCFADPNPIKTRWLYCISFLQRWIDCTSLADLDFWDAYISWDDPTEFYKILPQLTELHSENDTCNVYVSILQADLPFFS